MHLLSIIVNNIGLIYNFSDLVSVCYVQDMKDNNGKGETEDKKGGKEKERPPLLCSVGLLPRIRKR